METYTAAAIQVHATPDLDRNLAEAARLIQASVDAGASLVALPENFSFLGPEEEKVARAAGIAQRSEAFVLDQARQHGITLLGGSYPAPSPSDESRTLNHSLLAGPDGMLAEYDKMHLFDVDLPGQFLRESDTVVAGDETVVFSSEPLGALGMSICYDLRFPELYRALSERGAEVLLIPAAFTRFTGQHHWALLVRARAVENTCYVIAPNQCGTHFGTRVSYGHSLIVDPWGEVIGEIGDDPGIVTGVIDPLRISDVRRQIPSLRNRRI